MRLQAEGAPDPLHRADREATVARHAARAPVRRVLRLALQRAGDDRFDARIVDRAWRTGARFVAQSLDPLVKKAAAPLAERHGMHAKLAADRLFSSPSAHARMIRARWASACAVFGRAANAVSSERSASVSISASSRRPAMSASRLSGRKLHKLRQIKPSAEGEALI